MKSERHFSFLQSCFEPNPVFKRELRARWRRPAAYLTLFFYAAPLALGMALFYANNAPESYRVSEVGEQMPRVGRDLFLALIVLQVVAWLLIAPAIASAAIASERERGLLEALQLANLPARRVVLGKWLSLLSFMALLFLVPLPVVAICFYFGGVTPEEFGRAAFTIFVTAIFGSALGLWFSSRRQRPVHALRDAFVFLLVWWGLAFFAYDRSAAFHTLPLMVKRACSIAELAHPVFVMGRFGAGDFKWPVRDVEKDETSASLYAVPTQPGFAGSTAAPAPVIVAPLPPLYISLNQEKHWAANLALLAAFSLFFFALAVRGTGQTLPDAAFLRRDWVGRLKARLESRAAKRRSSRLQSKAQQALFNELPFLSAHSFDNPVFGRELRGRTRLKGGPLWLWLMRVLFIAVPTLLYIQALAEVNLSLPRAEAFARFAHGGLALLALYAAISGAGAFTREHEGGTWEGLKLTMLQPGQILSGKIWPLVIALSALSLLLLPGFVLCLGQSPLIDSGAYRTGYAMQQQITLRHLAVAFAVLLSTGFAVGCAAMFVSWLCHRTPLAVGLSLLCGAFLCLLMPAPFQSAMTTPAFTLEALPKPEPKPVQILRSDGSYAARQWQSDEAYRRHADEMYRTAHKYYHAERQGLLWCPVTMLCFGCILLLILSVLMRQQFRDEKQGHS